MTRPTDRPLADHQTRMAQHLAMQRALERGTEIHQAVDADLRWARQKLMAAEVNPLGRVRFGRRDRALAAMVAQTIRQTMPPVLLYWCPRLQQLLRDHHLHLQPVPLPLQEDALTPGAHRHVNLQPAGVQIWQVDPQP